MTEPHDELGAASCSASLDVAGCCISLAEARGVIRRRERYADELMEWMDERRNAPDFTTLGMIQERLRPLCSKANATSAATEAHFPCGECGMLVVPEEYHPYGACLMFMASHHAGSVRAHVEAIHAQGYNAGLQAASNLKRAMESNNG